MRVKSVPRHIVRKTGAKVNNSFKTNGAVKNDELILAKILRNNNHVKTINFTNYYDILQGAELLDLRRQATSDAPGKWTPFPMEEKIEALDLSKSSGVALEAIESCAESKELKDTYLYQIMTDPDLLTKISQQKQSTPCPHCKKIFSCENDMRRHIDGQSGDSSQLICCVCGKSFGQRRYLRYHQRCHSERNKFSCSVCPRKYSRLDNLTRHNVFHTNPDKFPCNSCDRAFARKDLLNKHLKCHENRYKFPCHICRKYFKGQISLENHNKLYHLGAERARN